MTFKNVEERNRELFKIARDVMKNAYAPFSKFQVGAAIYGKDGRIYTGVNVENSSYGGTICAERTACVKAVSEGCKEFEALAVVTSEGEGYPCGICRQFLFEFGGDLEIITGTDENHLKVCTLNELFPGGFKL